MLVIYLNKNSRCLISGWTLKNNRWKNITKNIYYIGNLFIQAHIKNRQILPYTQHI